MTEHEVLTAKFEESHSNLRAIAHQMLGSMSDADDAVHDAWIRLSRSDTSDVDKLEAWLTTVVARVCLDMLRSRRGESISVQQSHVVGGDNREIESEVEPQLADSVGPALVVALEPLTPAERLAFVLHDMFAIRFDAIARIVGCSPTAARQHASRARRRVHGPTGSVGTDPHVAP